MAAALACYAGVVPRVDSQWRSLLRGADHATRVTVVAMGPGGGRAPAIRRDDRIGRWARRLAVRKGGMKARVALARRLSDEVVAMWPPRA